MQNILSQKQEELVKMKQRCRKVSVHVVTPYVNHKSPDVKTIKARPVASMFNPCRPLIPKMNIPKVINIIPAPLHAKVHYISPSPPIRTRLLPSRKARQPPPIDKENLHACLKPCLPLKAAIEGPRSRPISARSPVTPVKRPPDLKYEEGRSTVEVLEKALKLPKRAACKFNGRLLAKATIF